MELTRQGEIMYNIGDIVSYKMYLFNDDNVKSKLLSNNNIISVPTDLEPFKIIDIIVTHSNPNYKLIPITERGRNNIYGDNVIATYDQIEPYIESKNILNINCSNIDTNITIPNDQFNIKLLYNDVVIPCYAHDGDSGMDIRTYIDIDILPQNTVAIPTGFALNIPYGYEVQIRPRSGLSLNKPIIIPNSPATIDSNYKGEIKVIMRNISLDEVVSFKKGDRIAQMVFCSVLNILKLNIVDTLTESNRGESGFGSSGVK